MTKRSATAWLAAAFLLAACEADPVQKPTPVAKAPEPKEAPIVEPPPAAPESDQLAKTLLGLNQKPRPPAAAKPMKRTPPPSPNLAKEEEMDMTEYPLEPGLTDQQFQQAIDDWDGFKNCLAMAAYRNGRSAENGALKVKFEIETSGAVVKSRVLEAKSPELAECVESRSKNIRFPSFAGNERITKEAKFIF